MLYMKKDRENIKHEIARLDKTLEDRWLANHILQERVEALERFLGIEYKTDLPPQYIKIKKSK